MKKICYLLSIAAHALAWVVIVNARFPVTIRPQPPRQVIVRIAEPPLPFIADGQPVQVSSVPGSPPALPAGGGAGIKTGRMGNSGPGSGVPGGAGTFAGAGGFSLKSHAAGDFRLAAAGKIPDPWTVSRWAPPPARLPALRPGPFRPATGRNNAGGRMFLLPFDIRERAVADWTQLVLARIEGHWIIPASGRLAFSGRVKITLTIERQGRQQALVVDEANVPEALTLAALHAIQSSLPFPPLPENVAGTALSFTFVFSYND